MIKIPDGWKLEPLERLTDFMLLTTAPTPMTYFVTIDFSSRGFRSGYSTTSRLVGHEWNKPRKKYVGRGWKQALVDDAVKYLQEVLK